MKKSARVYTLFRMLVLLLAALPTLAFAEATSSSAMGDAATTTITVSSTSTSVATNVASTTPPKTNEGIEALVRARFPDALIMLDIARCESRFRQYTDTGNPLRGGLGSAMIGIFQIHESVHATSAETLGMDIYSTEGNLAYARHLYDQSKTDPWISSISCWNPMPVSESLSSSESESALKANLSFGMVHAQVLLLQKLLNASGNIVAAEGPGSPSQETMKFGSLTRAAVRNFQCKNSIVCEGDESSTGYGFVGPRTRVALQGVTPVDQTEKEKAHAAEIARLEAIIAELTAQLLALQKSMQN